MVKRMVAMTFDANQGRSGVLMISKRSNEVEAKLNSQDIQVVVTHHLHERCCDWEYGSQYVHNLQQAG